MLVCLPCIWQQCMDIHCCQIHGRQTNIYHSISMYWGFCDDALYNFLIDIIRFITSRYINEVTVTVAQCQEYVSETESAVPGRQVIEVQIDQKLTKESNNQDAAQVMRMRSYDAARGGFKAESLIGHITRKASSPLPSSPSPPLSSLPFPPLEVGLGPLKSS